MICRIRYKYKITMNDKIEFKKHCRCPQKCFCKYDEHELRDIGYKKLIQRVPTVKLIETAKTAREKELISVVSMLDLDDVVAEIMIKEKMSGESCNVLGCRENLRKRLFKLLEVKD